MLSMFDNPSNQNRSVVRVLDLPPEPPVFIPPSGLAPSAPSGLQAQASPGQVRLSWQDNSVNEDGFKIRRRGPADAGFVDIAAVGANVTAYTDASVQPNTTYTYRVRAFNASGGAASNDAVVSTPGNEVRNAFTMGTRAADPILVAGASTTFAAGQFEKFTNGIPTLDFVNARVSITPPEGSVGLSLFPGNPVETFQPVKLTITTTPQTPARDYLITIDGVSAEDGRPYSPGRIPLVVTAAPKVVLDVTPGMRTVRAGMSAQYELRLQRDAFTQGVQVELSANESRLPPGVLVSFDPPAPTGNRATMTVTTERVELPEEIELRVRGRTPGVQVQAASARLKIQPEVTVTVTPTSATLDAGQSQRFDFSVMRMGYGGPVKIAPGFRSPQPMFAVTSTPSDFSNGSIFQANVQIKAGTASGDYTLFARPQFPSGANVLFNEVEVPVRVRADGLLQLAAERGGVAVSAGETESLLIGLASIMPSGLQGSIELSLDTGALPQGVSVRFDGEEERILQVDRAAASVLAISADELASGSGSFTVNGRYREGPNVEVRPVTVMVQVLADAAVVVDFFGATRSVEQGDDAVYTLLVKAVGYTGEVTLSVPDLPPGVPRAVFEPNPVRVSSAQDPMPVSLRFKTDNVPVGTYMFSVLGNATPAADVTVVRRGTLDVTDAPLPLPAPDIDGFTPTRGTVGTPVTIAGSNFSAGAQVTFNGVPAPATVLSATRIDTVVPPGATRGRIGVKTVGAPVLSDEAFEVLAAGAVSLSVAPSVQVALPGQRLRYAVGLARTNFPGPVQLSVDGLPEGSLASFSESPALGQMVSLDVQLPARVSGNAFTLTISGQAAGLTITPVSSVLRLKGRPGRIVLVPEGLRVDASPQDDERGRLVAVERELALLKSRLG